MPLARGLRPGPQIRDRMDYPLGFISVETGRRINKISPATDLPLADTWGEKKMTVVLGSRGDLEFLMSVDPEAYRALIHDEDYENFVPPSESPAPDSRMDENFFSLYRPDVPEQFLDLTDSAESGPPSKEENLQTFPLPPEPLQYKKYFWKCYRIGTLFTQSYTSCELEWPNFSVVKVLLPDHLAGLWIIAALSDDFEEDLDELDDDDPADPLWRSTWDEARKDRFWNVPSTNEYISFARIKDDDYHSHGVHLFDLELAERLPFVNSKTRHLDWTNKTPTRRNSCPTPW